MHINFHILENDMQFCRKLLFLCIYLCLRERGVTPCKKKSKLRIFMSQCTCTVNCGSVISQLVLEFDLHKYPEMH